MNKDKIGIIVVFTIILSVMFYIFYQEKELSENKISTEGKIIDYFNIGGKKYIKYVFKVNNEKMFNEKRVYPFTCENGIEGCVGENFTIIYSSKDPNNNEIDLGKYNEYRPNRIRMFELDN